MKRVIAALVVVLVAWPTSAALDSERKRGSTMMMSLPGRPWLAFPDGGFSRADRLSLILYSSNAPEIPPIHYYYHQGGAQ